MLLADNVNLQIEISRQVSNATKVAIVKHFVVIAF